MSRPTEGIETIILEETKSNRAAIREQLARREGPKRPVDRKAGWASASPVEISVSRNFTDLAEESQGGPMTEHSVAVVRPSHSPNPASGVQVNNSECCVIL